MPDLDTPTAGEPQVSALLRSDHAAPPRTLVDILRQAVADGPDSPALDNGASVLTYDEFSTAASVVADQLHDRGVGRGDRVGIRIDSGTTDLYVAIMAVLMAGAAYVPVDVDDPDRRARTVFDEAQVAAIIGNGLVISTTGMPRQPVQHSDPDVDNDAWIIFTSGSTGTPKGVAVTHRSAAAFVDAEAGLFLRDRPIGPGDRVMAGLSVAFDASCEEMWLAWRNGACLVPAPRSLVKSGTDLGPWMVANAVSVVSTVPTLVSLWPHEALAGVRLLILGGEACPPEIGARLASSEREVWNTYGPTEATVVACAARLSAEPPVRIGLPLEGWDLAVVNAEGQSVGMGESGELIIGGAGLARYLDPDLDAEKFAPMPSLGWDRAYRSGDIVSLDPAGLVFVGRADEQIKLGGRRIELGEIDSALLALPGVDAAASAIRVTGAGNKILVGYVSTSGSFDLPLSMEILRQTMPHALVPRLVELETLPTRTSGKIDRDALPWPPLATSASPPDAALTPTATWIRELWFDLLGAAESRATDDFFTLGGGSLTAAQLVARLRTRFPEVTVADIYEQPTLSGLADELDAMSVPTARPNSSVPPVAIKTQAGQVLFTVLLRSISGIRWMIWLAAANQIVEQVLGWSLAPQISWVYIVIGWLLMIAPPSRLAVTALGARLVLQGIAPGDYPRGGKVHLRLWLAERFAEEMGANSLSGAAWMPWYARRLGATIGKGVDLHCLPPITGLLNLGDGCSIEPEVDLTGHWVDGGVLHIGAIQVGRDARVGVRSLLGPGATVGDGAEVAAGSAVFGSVPDGQFWSGAPARPIGPSRGPFETSRPPSREWWAVAYAFMAMLISALPILAIAAGIGASAWFVRDSTSLSDATPRLLLSVPVATVLAFITLALLILVLVRIQSIGLRSGTHAVHGFRAWQAWSILRVLDEARTWLFPLYSSTLTPIWLRALGARIGSGVEASTVLMLPPLTTVNDGAFLADDTMLGMYELGGGWLRIEQVKIGRHAFVGNSGMTAPGRKVPKGGLVAVLSAAPRRLQAKAGTSWLGSPPTKLRRTANAADASRTYEPSRGVRLARLALETCRGVALIASVLLAVAVVLVLSQLARDQGWWAATLVTGCVLMVAGVIAAAVTSAVKWLLVGRVGSGEHPLWSSFVWRNELVDTFVEVLAAPWFARTAVSTPLMSVWLRSLGADIGRGVWCESYWFPEPDLITVGAGATVNRGCVVQTHLFHDRILSMDTVTLSAGATLGPHGVILPAARLGPHATIGPVSLVMRGEAVPDKTRWIGNPIGPWDDAVSMAAE